MGKIAVVTDTNSSIDIDEAEGLGLYVVPMPVQIGGKEYFEGVDCTYEHFFELLAAGNEVSTSQPSPYSVTSVWDKALEDHDEVIYLPMMKALSSSMATAKMLAADYGGKVHVVDNNRISILQRLAALEAVRMAEKGLKAEDIVRRLEENGNKHSIYLAVNTLELLKKSGRVTAAGAAVATILDIKPVLQIQGGKLDAFSKARGMASAEKVMLKALEKDLNERFADDRENMQIETCYTGDRDEALKWLDTVQTYFDDMTVELYKLPMSISCHVGAGVKALGCMRRIPESEMVPY